MSKERELIQRAQQLALEASYIIGDAKPEFTKLCADLDEYLSKPEQEQAVAWIYEKPLADGFSERTLSFGFERDFDGVITPLYAQPLKRKPLSDDEIKKIWLMSAVFRTNLEKAVALTRAIEKTHGITDEC